MYISDNYKCVLISNVNTGSRSICKFLADNYGFEEKTKKHSYRLANVQRDFGEDYANQVKEYSVIMTSREPFSRAVSIWARLKENKNIHDGYGIYWKTFPEFAKYIEIFQSLPSVNYPGYESFYNAKFCEEIQSVVGLPLAQNVVKNWAIEDFGKVDYILDFVDSKSIELLPFVSSKIDLLHIGKSGVDSSVYDTEENRRLIKIWDKGING